MKNVQVFKKVFSVLALSLIVGSTQNTHAAGENEGGFNANRLLMHSIWMVPLLRVLTKEKRADNPIRIASFSDLIQQLKKNR